jgi:hypothetical protein
MQKDTEKLKLLNTASSSEATTKKLTLNTISPSREGDITK